MWPKADALRESTWAFMAGNHSVSKCPSETSSWMMRPPGRRKVKDENRDFWPSRRNYIVEFFYKKDTKGANPLKNTESAYHRIRWAKRDFLLLDALLYSQFWNFTMFVWLKETQTARLSFKVRYYQDLPPVVQQVNIEDTELKRGDQILAWWETLALPGLLRAQGFRFCRYTPERQ